jgi:hypothetical protein
MEWGASARTRESEEPMTDTPRRPEWPDPLAPYWIESARVLRAASGEDETPGRDGMGNPGQIVQVSHRGKLGVTRTRESVVAALEGTDLDLSWSGAHCTELKRRRTLDTGVLADPFLLEDSLKAVVKGRDFPGASRTVVEKKLAALRAELADDSTTSERKSEIKPMVAQLEQGLRSTVEVTKMVRRFRPTVEVQHPVEAIGRIAPIRTGTRIVYRVNSNDQESGSEGEAEAMAFHVLGVGRNEAVLMFTGGVHGVRHLLDLDESRVHNAWFANRERAKSEATAPWIGRALFRDLMDFGSGEIVIHARRDAEPIGIEKIGEDESFLRIDGRPMMVPVIRCQTTQQDDLVILNDPESPLVLRLDEKGAELVRTIDDILSAPGHAFVFPGDAEIQAAAAEANARLDAEMAAMEADAAAADADENTPEPEAPAHDQ